MQKSLLFSMIFLVAFSNNFMKAQNNKSAQEQKEANGQTYTIINNGSITDIQPYIDALNHADMKYHRLKNTRTTITFNTGVTVQLFSAIEVIANGFSLNISDYPDNFESTRQEPVFSLGQNNFILEQHHPINKNN
jgi:hypothetical protein